MSKCSFQGGRTYNEDSVLFQQRGQNAIAIVADGLGGCGNGDIASDITVKTMGRLFLRNPIIDERHLKKWFDDTNREICLKQIGGIKMRSTAAAWFYNGKKFAAAHIGDSRLYYFRRGNLIFQTKDHSVPQMLFQAGEITEREIRTHEDRNKILRALGSKDGVQVEIKIWNEDVKAGDAFLLCSDGFWEYVWEDEMMEDLSNSRNPEQWLTLMNERIWQRAVPNNDNFSAVAIICL